MAISTARQFFDRIIAGGSAAVVALVTERMHETEWLDFKSGEHLDDDKSTWSEAVCGFGNNQGGVLIWGIDARPDTMKVDAACDVKPVANPEALRSRLQELLRTAVEPPLPGVEMRSLFQTGSAGPGFVVCFIPESDTKPHRAEMVTNKPYKIRIADAFINPSVSLLRSLFFPHSSPHIEVDVTPEWDEHPSGHAPKDFQIRQRVNLRNTSVVTATDIFVIVHPANLKIDLPYNALKHETSVGSGIEYPRPLHPLSHGQLCVIRHQVAAVKRQPKKLRHTPDCQRFEVSFEVYAANMLPLRVGVEFGELDVLEKRRKTATYREQIPPGATGEMT